MEKEVFNRLNESEGWEEINPVTLSSDWSRVARLLMLAGLSVVGSLGNVYMISAVMIEDHLKKRVTMMVAGLRVDVLILVLISDVIACLGQPVLAFSVSVYAVVSNTFVVNVALADLLITGVVMPASAIVILAGLDPATEVCNVQWFLAILSWLVTVLSLAATAAENYSRLCLSPETYARLTTRRITIIVLSIWAVSIVAVTIQQVFNLGPSYCRRPSGILLYQAIAAGIFFLLPALLTTFYYAKTILQIRLARAHPSFKPPVAFSWDYSLMKTNMYSFFLFFLFWVPFGVILFVDSVKSISPKLFYNLAWIALSKSCVNNFLYCILDRHFRSAYINLFHYCCCKTTVTFSRRTREVARPSGDVRVHIIPGYNMYSYTSPQRSGRECTKVSSGKRASANRPPRPHHNRDVYEL